jgi:hypothetical protein
MSDLETMSRRERAERYRAYATQAERVARQALGKAAFSYEIAAAQWRELADLTESRSEARESRGKSRVA